MCHGLHLLIREKGSGEDGDKTDGGSVAFFDKLLEYQCITSTWNLGFFFATTLRRRVMKIFLKISDINKN